MPKLAMPKLAMFWMASFKHVHNLGKLWPSPNMVSLGRPENIASFLAMVGWPVLVNHGQFWENIASFMASLEKNMASFAKHGKFKNHFDLIYQKKRIFFTRKNNLLYQKGSSLPEKKEW